MEQHKIKKMDLSLEVKLDQSKLMIPHDKSIFKENT